LQILRIFHNAREEPRDAVHALEVHVRDLLAKFIGEVEGEMGDAKVQDQGIAESIDEEGIRDIFFQNLSFRWLIVTT